jgi:hypothetical protein
MYPPPSFFNYKHLIIIVLVAVLIAVAEYYN